MRRQGVLERVAALYDIHGNLPALEAVLDRVRRSAVDCIVVGGDVVPGPMPGETLDLLLGLDVPVHPIQGNSEVAVLAELAASELAPMPESARAIVRWTARHLRPDHARWLASWPRKLRLELEGLGDVLFCHGTPRHDNEIFTRATPEESLLPLFEGLGVSIVVCGHTHMQFDRRVGDARRQRGKRRDAVRLSRGRLAPAWTRRPTPAHALRSRTGRGPDPGHSLPPGRRLCEGERPESAVRGTDARTLRRSRAPKSLTSGAVNRRRGWTIRPPDAPKGTLKEWLLAMPPGGRDADFARPRGRAQRARRVDL
jgi:predicted phosphodiesterase